jgi:hypothetical protein
LQHKLEEDEKKQPIGIERLLADHDATISLVPQGNKRLERRKKAAS